MLFKLYFMKNYFIDLLPLAINSHGHNQIADISGMETLVIYDLVLRNELFLFDKAAQTFAQTDLFASIRQDYVNAFRDNFIVFLKAKEARIKKMAQQINPREYSEYIVFQQWIDRTRIEIIKGFFNVSAHVRKHLFFNYLDELKELEEYICFVHKNLLEYRDVYKEDGIPLWLKIYLCDLETSGVQRYEILLLLQDKYYGSLCFLSKEIIRIKKTIIALKKLVKANR